MNDFFGFHNIPKGYGVCPQCKGALFADVVECVTATGTPTQTGFTVYCTASQERRDIATEKAMGTGDYNLTRTVEECLWDYDQTLRAQAQAYKYLKNLRK